MTILLLALLAGGAPAAGVAAEPKLQLRVSREPYHVGVPVDLHVHATGFERQPEPSCSVDPPEQGVLRLVGIIPNFSSSLQIINGRVRRSETATFTCQYQFTAAQPGTYRLGPFRMTQGSVERETERYSIELEPVPLDPRLRVRVLLPDREVYVGQQLPITIEWWVDEELQNRIQGYSIHSELFERDESFRFIGDEPAARGEQSLEIVTPSGKQGLKATVEQRRHGRRKFLVVAAKRTLIPLRAGEFELGSASVNVNEVTRWQRDFFGGRRPADTRQIFSRDEPRRLVVKAPPEAGRPESFAGAVGRGFSYEVSADRSVVQLGDPITLTLTVRGDGILSSIGLPSLTADGGLSTEHFRLPEGDAPGKVSDGAKVFRVSLRVLDDSVGEIPALAYSWFDPELGEYQTTRSQPIALSVRPAQVISAADVVAATPAEPHPEEEAAAGEPGPEAVIKRGSFSLTGADLSIEQDPARLLGQSSVAPELQIASYGGSLLVLLLAIWLRRRAELDPEVRRQRETYRDQRKRIAAARSKPRHEALAEIAAALREIVAAAPELRSDELDDFLRECDAVIYAPERTADSRLEPELAERAQSLASAMGKALP